MTSVRGKTPLPGCVRANWVVAASVAALLLAGPARSGVWAAAEAAPKLPADLAWVPADAVGFVTVRVSDLWSAALEQKLRQQLAAKDPESLQDLEEIERGIARMGLLPGNIERATLVFLNRSSGPVGILTTVKPYARALLLDTFLPHAKEMKYQGKTYYALEAARGPALSFVSDCSFVVGDVGDVQTLLATSGQGRAAEPLSAALAVSGQGHQVVAGFNPGDLFKELGNNLPAQAQPLRPLLSLRSVRLTANVGTEVRMDLRLDLPRDDATEDDKAVKAALTLAREFLSHASKEGTVKTRQESPRLFEVLKQAEAALQSVMPHRHESAIDVPVRIKIDRETLAAACLEIVVSLRQAARPTASLLNLRKLALAMYEHHDRKGTLPAAATYGKDGQALLSWRVTLLPYLGEEKLYKEFKLDEPWDSAHNKTLLARMPKVYAPVRGKPRDAYSTYYQVFTGPTTAFGDGRTGPKLPDNFSDGPGQTILIVETEAAVPWTKPLDMSFLPGAPLPRLGGVYKDVFCAALADGSTRLFKKDLSMQTLRAIITASGRDLAGDDF